jgi:hypothetical protein
MVMGHQPTQCPLDDPAMVQHLELPGGVGPLNLNPAVEQRPSPQATDGATNPTVPQFTFSVSSVSFINSCNKSAAPDFEEFNCRI